MEKEMIREQAQTIIETIESAGKEAQFVGGCVRDEELGIPVDDYDITTNATFEQIAELFSNEDLNRDGEDYFVLKVNDYEVASYRKEEYITPGKPIVSPASSFYEDTLRRDFTVNAMGKTSNGTIIDYHEGMQDLKNRLIRVIGEPVIRFKDDPIRIIRMMYLASKLNFDIDKKAQETAMTHGDLLHSVSRERIGMYIEKCIKHNCLSTFMKWLRKLGLVHYVLPELAHTVGLKQNSIYHDSDVYDHIVRVVRSIEENIPDSDPHKRIMVLAAIYHDCAKGLEGIRGVNPKNGQPNDLDHEEAGVPIAREALSQLGCHKNTIEEVCFLIEYHGMQLEASPKRSTVIRIIRRMVPRFKDKKTLVFGLTNLIRFMYSDADGFEPNFGAKVRKDKESAWEVFCEVFSNVAFYRSDLLISGRDLVRWGITGKQVGEVLDYLVQENLRYAEEIYNRLIKKGWVIELKEGEDE